VDLETTECRYARQIRILSWYYEQYAKYLPPHRIIRYEQLISSGGSILAIVATAAARLNTPLENRNVNTIYDRQSLRPVAEMLFRSGGAMFEFYSRHEMADLMSKLLDGGM
jgi:hypothetical protein